MVSDDGRWVFYETNCGAPDGQYLGAIQNILAYDLVTGLTKFANVLPRSRQRTTSILLDVSADGRFVVFAGGLDTSTGSHDQPGIFVRDLLIDSTERICDYADGFSSFASISANGQTVAFTRTRHPNPPIFSYQIDLYAWDRNTSQVRLVNAPVRVSRDTKGSAGAAKVSADGRYVFFTSTFDTLVPNDANGKEDVFRYDMWTNTNSLISVNSSGTSSGNGDSWIRFTRHDHQYYGSSSTISSDGRFVIFSSSASDLVPGIVGPGAFVRDLTTGVTSLVSVNSSGDGSLAATDGLISANGQIVSFAGNQFTHDYGQPAQAHVNNLYRRDLNLGQTSVTNLLYPNNPNRSYSYCMNTGISADGRYELFTAVLAETTPSGAPKVELYLLDHQLGSATLIGLSTLTAEGAKFANISAAGNTVVFATGDKLLDEDTDNGRPDIYVFHTDQPPATSLGDSSK